MTTPHIGTSTVYGNQRARNTFTPAQQAIMDQGGNYAGYAVVDGHFTYVGAGRTGQDAYYAVYPGQQPAPNKAGGDWMAGPAGVVAGFTGDQTTNVPSTAQVGDVNAAVDKAVKDANNRDALALIQGTLKQYGLPDSLGDWAWSELVAGKGMSEVLLDLQQRPEFKAEFPEIDQRLQKNLAPLSPGEIVTYRQQARQIMRAAGLPEGLYDSKDDFTKYLVGDTSLKELSDRVSIAAQALYGNPQDLAESRRLGFTDGEAVAQILNPDIAQPLIEKRWAAAQLSSAGVTSGFGGLTADEALGLAGQGVTQQQAQQGFGQLQHDQQLFGSLDSGEQQIGRQDQLGAALGGNAQAQQRIEQRAARRKAQFSGGGSFAGGQSGLTGLGGSNG